MTLEEKYNSLVNTPSDINEHLPTLMEYASHCNHVTEMGVRSVVSTYGLMMGKPSILKSYDIVPIEFYGIDRNELSEMGRTNGVQFEFIQANVLHIEIEETDFLFIDTYHTYHQLRDELKLHSKNVRKYLGFHDTTAFGEVGEGGTKGLWQAITEFLEENGDWILENRYENNNGLTILKRIPK
jgi:hypothetical protein